MSRVAIGDRFGRLVVTALIQDKKNPKARCVCDCGTVTEPQRGALKNGRAMSCGCLRREKIAAHIASVTLSTDERRRRKCESNKKWNERNHDRWRAINRKAVAKHYRAHPEKANANWHIRRVRKLAALGNVSDGIKDVLLTKQRWLCACCRCSLIKNKAHLDHIIPIARGGIHDDSNLQMLCATCNISKGCRNPIEFMQSRGMLL